MGRLRAAADHRRAKQLRACANSATKLPTRAVSHKWPILLKNSSVVPRQFRSEKPTLGHQSLIALLIASFSPAKLGARFKLSFSTASVRHDHRPTRKDKGRCIPGSNRCPRSERRYWGFGYVHCLPRFVHQRPAEASGRANQRSVRLQAGSTLGDASSCLVKRQGPQVLKQQK
jgi:hypothetical protein